MLSPSVPWSGSSLKAVLAIFYLHMHVVIPGKVTQILPLRALSPPLLCTNMFCSSLPRFGSIRHLTGGRGLYTRKTSGIQATNHAGLQTRFLDLMPCLSPMYGQPHLLKLSYVEREWFDPGGGRFPRLDTALVHGSVLPCCTYNDERGDAF